MSLLANNRVCPDEDIARSKFGVVRDEETVARVVVDPRHVRKNGELKPGLFPPTHIAEGGLSLMRVDHMDADELAKQAEKIAEHKVGDKVAGVVLAKVEPIRKITDERGVRSFCVIDDPIKPNASGDGNEAHALAKQSGTLHREDPELKRVRGVLIDLFSGLTAISDVYAKG